MLPAKQTVLDMLRHAVPQAESSARKRSAFSLLDADFEDFAPPPSRKFSSPMLNHSQKTNSSSTMSVDSKTVVRPPLTGEGSSCSAQHNEVALTFKSCHFNH
jgi:hypothetical protein